LEAVAAAQAEAHVVLAETLAAWNAGDDSLAIGASSVRITSARHNGFGALDLRTAVRVHRTAARRFVIAVSAQVGQGSAVRARRRLQLVVERDIASDTAAPKRPPAPLARWSTSDIY
jgi:hypothetical protein